MAALNLQAISTWNPLLKDKPLIISGPCSAETEKQLLDTALALKKIDRVKVIRAGIWKPRTSPNSFEGVGNIGLQWLNTAKKETGLLTTVEVTTPEDIEACLQNEVDILWIGARSSSNPVYIRKLADALKGIDIPVLIKNPIHPDIDLWIGTLERFNKVGVSKLAVVHRGFFPFEKTALRNIPKWEIPLELKRRFPNLPIICDPSHIAGNVDSIFEIAQKALYLGMDGLMIESHIDPKSALSDAKQQMSPQQLSLLLDSLTYSHFVFESNLKHDKLEVFREQLDSIDQQMIELLSQRMEIVEQIGEYKKKNNLTIFQLRRWQKTINLNTKIGRKMGLSREFLVKLVSLIHMESILRQNDVMNRED
ncbi:MAG: bifunctional 3-deoxy-7-phosphoheptulonate synthase/chorismate mutase type II [Bacteroidetes bacterium]|nr:bifunctional 3-deoxy-7-phosphoheptulonate synthase/chorismate mutase type II [Bacteroidota bacterium]MBT3424630.1 bifunctional 3-deoxy-7-phosphoheptulonate synthase/chorismate mutase type II [Bacteroidota bacterium]MBT3801678.1 bifunctional 3-deoxy-7-phosphoheptulonate synthase/chorismate mutase type II [Bacteroidota bacterium]MBT3933187.1 bifunctional 3-deoxy-7-phosphoheptulonate synthase/chorismate mutase type II [Bacteroidota bacterium]MBT4337127.1 bifunctional 3-deoxy-7-phosphoheptulonat